MKYGTTLPTLLAIWGVAAMAFADVPGQIHYQGRLVSGATPVNGSVAMEFRLFDVAQGGTALFSETQSVAVVDGTYAAYIGASQAIPPAFFRDHLETYLEVIVERTPLSPRDRIVAVGYAFNAQFAQEAAVARSLAPGPTPLHMGSTTNVIFLGHMGETNQVVGTNGEVIVNWRAESFDTASAFNFSPGADRFTAPVNGYYRFSAQLNFTGGRDSKLATVAIRKNGTSNLSVYVHRMVGSGTFSMFTSCDAYLAVNEYVDVWARQISGFPQELGGSPAYTYFSGYLLQQP